MSLNSFNLIDEPWILMADGSELSLRDVFSGRGGDLFLGGNPIEIVSFFKLLQAIALSAVNITERELSKISTVEYSRRICDYLEVHRDAFNLYDEEKPFLQMPAVKNAKKKSYRTLSPYLNDPNSNTVVTSHHQLISDKKITDAMMARSLVTQMNYAFGGKKTDAKFSLDGKNAFKTAPVGASLSYFGALHNLVVVDGLLETLKINHFVQDNFDFTHGLSFVQISDLYPGGIGVAPWECMPTTETCEVAERLKTTLMGRLVGLGRFCLIDREDKCFHYAMGIDHPGYKRGVIDPTHSALLTGKEPKLLWANVSNFCWRSLPSVLSFMSADKGDSYRSVQVSLAIHRLRKQSCKSAKILALGIQVGSSTGETMVTGLNDFVYSSLTISPEHMGSLWFVNLKNYWSYLDFCSMKLFLAVRDYSAEIGSIEHTKHYQRRVLGCFWSSVSRDAEKAVLLFPEAYAVSFGVNQEQRASYDSVTQLYERAHAFAVEAYAVLCPNNSRKLRAYAIANPNFATFKNTQKGCA